MIGTRFRLQIKTMAFALGMVVCTTAARANNTVACSAFSGKGDAATATIVNQRLSLQIAFASGRKPLAISAPIADSSIAGCNVFFDKDNHYLSVSAFHLGLKPGPLGIFVVDLIANRLISNFVVRPDAGSPKLVGFLRGDSTLVVFASGPVDHPTRTFSTSLLRVTGEQELPPVIRTVPVDALNGVGNVSFADPLHNRFWFKSSPQFCPLRAVSLVDDSSDVAVADEAVAKAACDVESAIAYPNEDTLISAVSRDTGDLVTHVDFSHHKVAQIMLPSRRHVYTSMGRAVLSPDGQVFAVTRELLTNTLLGERTLGIELDIVQVSPLKVFERVRLKLYTDPASISVDHQNGAITVLSFGDGRWRSENLMAK